MLSVQSIKFLLFCGFFFFSFYRKVLPEIRGDAAAIQAVK